MRKIKILAVDYGWDSYGDIKTFAEELDWFEIEEEKFKRLEEAITNQHKLGKQHPIYGKSLLIVEDLTKETLKIDAFIDAYEEVTRKERIAKEKREEAARKAKEAKALKSIELKRKQLEKLKKELEDES